nr:hypothetical protein [Rhodococcus sp. MSC1_016]
MTSSSAVSSAVAGGRRPPSTPVYLGAADRDNTTRIGLGLSVVRGLVEARGGTITATDTPGGGLTMV